MSQPSEHDLPDLPDDVGPLAALPDEVEPLAAPAGAAAPGGERALRPLDKAPQHLRLAALVVVAGSLVPWMGHQGGWVTAAAAKLVALVGAWLYWQQLRHDWGPPLGGALGKLASLRLSFGKQAKAKPPRRNAPASAAAPSRPPAVLTLVAIAVAFGVGALWMPLADPTPGVRAMAGAAEVGMLAWAAFTWVHIAAFERWGSFNPLFPLMFLGILFAGLSRVVTAIGRGLGSLESILTLLGGAAVAAGGGLAAYTIVEALRQAKREGDEKKKAASEARRTARRGASSSAR